MKKIFTTFLVVVVSSVFLFFVHAEEKVSYTINATTSAITELSGTDNGNKTSFDLDLNISELPADFVIETAVLQFSTSGISTGSVSIVDKYKPLISNSIDILTLGTAGTKQTNKILANVLDWETSPSHNYGISFQAKNFGVANKVNFSDIKLLVTGIPGDSIAPKIIKQEILKDTLVTYKLTVETDEATKIVMNLGKTSTYDLVFKDDNYLTKHEIIVTNLQNGITYHYQVLALDQAGNEVKSPDYSFLSEITSQIDSSSFELDSGIFPPKNLAFEITKVENNYHVYLTWTASINADITGYVICRRIQGDQNFLELSIVEANVLNYTDDTVEMGIDYEYQLKSYKLNKISNDESTVKVSMPKVDDSSSQSKLPVSNNTGQVLMTLFVIAVFLFIAGYLVVRFVIPRFFVKKPIKAPLDNILNDPTLYEEQVTSEVENKPENE